MTRKNLCLLIMLASIALASYGQASEPFPRLYAGMDYSFGSGPSLSLGATAVGSTGVEVATVTLGDDAPAQPFSMGMFLTLGYVFDPRVSGELRLGYLGFSQSVDMDRFTSETYNTGTFEAHDHLRVDYNGLLVEGLGRYALLGREPSGLKLVLLGGIGFWHPSDEAGFFYRMADSDWPTFYYSDQPPSPGYTVTTLSAPADKLVVRLGSELDLRFLCFSLYVAGSARYLPAGLFAPVSITSGGTTREVSIAPLFLIPEFTLGFRYCF